MDENLTYIIPTEELSLQSLNDRRMLAIKAGKARAAAKWNQNDTNLTARDANYVTDFIAPIAPAAIAGLAGWVTQPFAAVGGIYSVFAQNAGVAIAPVCPTNQLWVFYGAAVLTLAGPDPAGVLQFRYGTAANLRYQFDLENLYGKNVVDGYFSKVVTYENPDIATVTVIARAALGAVGCRLKLKCFIIETMQTTVT